MSCRRTRALVLLPALVACGGRERAPRDDDCGRAATFVPSEREVPLPEDYRASAEKRIGADNYRRELARIERELARDLD